MNGHFEFNHLGVAQTVGAHCRLEHYGLENRMSTIYSASEAEAMHQNPEKSVEKNERK